MGDAGILITQHLEPISLCFFYELKKCVMAEEVANDDDM